jgi:signal peptide peptidase SppA
MSDTADKQKIAGNAIPLSPFWLVRHEAFLASVARLMEIDLSAYYDRTESVTEEKPYEVRDGVALIHLTGYLTRDLSWWSWYFGGTSSIRARMHVMQAAEDPDVSSILLCCYSPGGEVYGVGDLHDSIVAAGKKKKTWAYIADEGCSALYWAICGCQRIVCNATAIVGSIGIMSVVQDWSKAYQKAGIKVEVFKSGPHKGAGEEGTALSDEQRAEKQRLVDAIAEQFFAAVEDGRGLQDDALDAVTDGRVFVGQEALEMGLVDEIGTLEATLLRLKPKEANPNNSLRRTYGATNTTPPAQSGNKEKPMFRELIAKLAASFAKLGRHHMAAAALGADENNSDDLVTRLNGQIEAEVQSAIAANPMLTALSAAEVKTPEQLNQLIAQAVDGRAASEEVNKALQAAAVRRFGQGEWKQYVEAYQHLPLAARKAVAEQWEKDAPVQTTVQARAERQTAPTQLPNHAIEVQGAELTAVQSEVKKNLAHVGKNGGSK